MVSRSLLYRWTLLLGLSLLLLTACGGGGSGDSGDAPGGSDATADNGGDGGDATDDTADAVRTRPNVKDLTTEQWDSIRAGVTAMKARDASDPTSWLYQANIHGTYDNQNLPAWNTCQHGSWFFFSWHRMYLYYFERILRDAAQDPDLNLPFWDYTDPTQRAIPSPFRSPTQASNPLYVAERNGGATQGINGGAQLPASATQFSVAMGFTNFTAPTGSPLGFGGQMVPAPSHFSSPHGQLESQPHDIIHVVVGGQGGWMSDPNFAARDPIFWFHHSNIDRLWNVWHSLGDGRSNPSDSIWLNTTFTFFDVGGVEVQLTGQQIVDSAAQLGYVYAEGSGSAPGTQSDIASLDAAAFTDDFSEQVSERTMAEPLGASSTASLEVPPAAIESGDGRPERYVLMVEDLDFGRPGVFYEVYAGLPDGQTPDPLGPFYVGNLGVFGQGVESGGHQHADAATLGYDVTRIVQRLRESGSWNGEFPVRFVRRGLEVEGLEAAEDFPDVHIGKVRVVRE